MAEQGAKRPSALVRKHLDAIEAALVKIEHGGSTGRTVYDIKASMVEAIQAAMWGEEDSTGPPEEPEPVPYQSVVADNLANNRKTAGITQEALASAMRAAGANNWKRVTVAETETSARSVSLEELSIHAALFGVPVLSLLMPRPLDRLRLSAQHSLNREGVEALWLGSGGNMGTGGPDWKQAADAVGARTGAKDWRPVVQFWGGSSEEAHDAD